MSVEGAKRYGVVLSADGALDAAATEALRGTMGDARGSAALPLFDRGGSIDELKSRCLTETGFPAPKAPVFANWMRSRAVA